MTLAPFIAGLLFGVVLTLWLRRPSGVGASPAPVVTDTSQDTADAPAIEAPPAEAETPTPPSEEAPVDRLHRLRREIEAEDERIQRPEDLAGFAQFREGVALLSGTALAPGAVLELLEGDSYAKTL